MADDLTTPAAPTQDTSGNSSPASGEQPQATWRDTLPDELKASPVLSKYADQNAAIKALVDAQALLGKKSDGIKVPGPDAKPEEREAFHKALGRPDTPDAYVMPKIEGMPEGMGIAPEVEKLAREGLHKLGLTGEQYSGAMQLLAQQALSERQASDQFRASERAALEAAHKDALPARLELANKAVLAEGGEALLKALDESGAGNYAAVIEYFAKRGDALGESVHKDGAGSSGAADLSKLSPAERVAEARRRGVA